MKPRMILLLVLVMLMRLRRLREIQAAVGRAGEIEAVIQAQVESVQVGRRHRRPHDPSGI